MGDRDGKVQEGAGDGDSDSEPGELANRHKWGK